MAAAGEVGPGCTCHALAAHGYGSIHDVLRSVLRTSIAGDAWAPVLTRAAGIRQITVKLGWRAAPAALLTFFSEGFCPPARTRQYTHQHTARGGALTCRQALAFGAHEHQNPLAFWHPPANLLEQQAPSPIPYLPNTAHTPPPRQQQQQPCSSSRHIGGLAPARRPRGGSSGPWSWPAPAPACRGPRPGPPARP